MSLRASPLSRQLLSLPPPIGVLDTIIAILLFSFRAALNNSHTADVRSRFLLQMHRWFHIRAKTCTRSRSDLKEPLVGPRKKVFRQPASGSWTASEAVLGQIMQERRGRIVSNCNASSAVRASSYNDQQSLIRRYC